jgi:hypothetical protein
MAANKADPLAATTHVVIGTRESGESIVYVPPGKGSKEFWKKVVRNQFLISLMGLYGGLACIVVGIVLVFSGVLGKGSWMAEAFGVSISDAPPGVVLFFIGLGMAQVTKFKVEVQRRKLQAAPRLSFLFGKSKETQAEIPEPPPDQGGLVDGVVVVGRTFLGRQGIEVPGGDVDEDFWTMVVSYQFFYSIAGFIGGFLNIIAGIVLFLNGTIGTSHWSADVLGMKFTDAAPGTVLMFIGLGFLHVTQYVIKIGDNRPRPNPGPLPPLKGAGSNPDDGQCQAGK